MKGKPNVINTPAIFWSRVEKTPDCWLWRGRLVKHPYRGGYGTFDIAGTSRYAHILAYQWTVGPVPDGLELDHLCRNRACVNPDHLEPVTHAENMRRGAHALKASCPHGHAFSGSNLILYTARGWTERRCRACKNANARSARARLHHTNITKEKT